MMTLSEAAGSIDIAITDGYIILQLATTRIIRPCDRARPQAAAGRVTSVLVGEGDLRARLSAYCYPGRDDGCGGSTGGQWPPDPADRADTALLA